MSALSYVLGMRERMEHLAEQVNVNMKTAQAAQKSWYDKTAGKPFLEPGQQVLFLLPVTKNSLLAKWQGPFVVHRKVGSACQPEGRSGT